jgi:small nuclear ribonucleoprotein (snRNP)-like protein
MLGIFCVGARGGVAARAPLEKFNTTTNIMLSDVQKIVPPEDSAATRLEMQL